MKKFALGLLVVLFFGAAVSLTGLSPAQAAPQPQYTQFPTPTPGQDGRILYLVQPGDTLYWIASVTGVSVDQLRQLNNLGTDDVLIAGTYILLGLAGPVEPTSAPGGFAQPTADALFTPTPTAIVATGEICVLLYLDTNGNTIFEEGAEYGMGDGEVSVTERLGTYSEKRTTEFSFDPITPSCFEDIQPGIYLVTMALPEGFNRTTDLSATIELFPGQIAYLNFGMQPNGDTVSESSQESQQSSNQLVGVVGVTFFLAGIGAAIYAAVNNRSRFSEGG
jgi:hypothetical protein